MGCGGCFRDQRQQTLLSVLNGLIHELTVALLLGDPLFLLHLFCDDAILRAMKVGVPIVSGRLAQLLRRDQSENVRHREER